MTQRQESFALCLDTDITDWLEVALAPSKVGVLIAAEMKQTFKIVNVPSHIGTRVILCHALRQCDWLEAQIHAKVVLKYIITEPGELCVVTNLIRQQQELFVTCSDTDMSDSYLVTATEPAVDRFGFTTFSAMELKRTLQIVDITT